MLWMLLIWTVLFLALSAHQARHHRKVAERKREARERLDRLLTPENVSALFYADVPPKRRHDES